MRRVRVFAALVAVFAALGCLGATAGAQEAPSRKLRLLQQIPVRLPASASALVGAPQCDDNGDLFFRASISDPPNAPVPAVVEVSSTGFPVQTFSLGAVPGFALSTTASLSDFVVTGDGQVYLLASEASVNGPDPDLSVIHFSSGGRYLSIQRLSPFFLPRRLALLSGGSYFLLALDRDIYLASQNSKFALSSFVYPVGLFFGRKGKLNREIALPNTAAPPNAMETASAGDPPRDPPTDFVATSYDGTIYVARRKPAFSLYVITNSGATVNSISVDPPFPHAAIAGLAADGVDKFVVEFAHQSAAGAVEESGAVFSVVGAESGVRLVDYHTTPETSGVLGCPTPIGFELLSHQGDGKLWIRFVGEEPAAKPAANKPAH